MNKKRCEACGTEFKPNPRSEIQRYCSQDACQRERKTRGQRERRARDPDYAENERRVQQDRRRRNPNYSNDYRKANPAYVARNREQQRVRDQKRRGQHVTASERLASEAACNVLATEAALNPSSSSNSPIKSGTYELRHVAGGSTGGMLATEAGLLVEIHVISDA
jgi:uncharacterized protein YdiU (UPF0061 family)